MNRHDRRAQAVKKRQIGRTIPTAVALHCAGPFSTPKQECELSISVMMPFDGEELFHRANSVGWFVTAVSERGTTPVEFALLCPACSRAVLPPELIAEARRHIQGSA